MLIYLVEDDTNIRELVLYTLRISGYEAEGFADAQAFWEAMKSKTPALILLDIMLPDEDGLSILKKLRNKNSTAHLPVIMLTAKSSEFDKVQGLDGGADDYVAKPFGMMELLSRIRALLRRSDAGEPASAQSLIQHGDVVLDTSRHTVTIGGAPVVLTLKEFDVLHALMASPGIVFSRDTLLKQVWGYEFEGETRTVDVHMRSLRQKLGAHAAIIETVRGVGYRLGEYV